jgi:hypothetical protein
MRSKNRHCPQPWTLAEMFKFKTMNKFFFILLYLLVANISFGQQVNFFADGSRWVYNTYESSEPGQEFDHYSDEQNIIHGDTIISDLRYYKLFSTFHNTLVVNIFPPLMIDSYDSVGPTFLRYDTLHHSVYYLPAIDSTERLIYNFNLMVGDTTPMQSPAFPTIISSIDTVTLFGVPLRRFFVGGEVNPPWADTRNVIIEGMGGSNGLTYFQPEWDVVSGGYYGTRFTCFQYGDSIYSPYNGPCPFIDFVSAVRPLEKQHELMISPNPTHVLFGITIGEELLNATFTIVDCLGRVAQSFKLTELNSTTQLNASGIYFWHIEHGGHLIKTGKLICK